MTQVEIAPGNILIVDDSPQNLTVLRQILTEQGYRVRPALNGEIALKTVQTTLPDLILLDIMMPDGPDGYEVCRRLKADERTRDIPVLFISALDETLDKLKAFQVGGVDYITKPFQAEEISARVKTHLELKRYRDQLEDQVKQRTFELEKRNIELVETTDALQEAIKNLHTIKITDGVYWLQIPEADLYILCGCPADVTKLMMKNGLISVTKKDEINFETGPNAILLSDILIQNGTFSNLAEFPVLQMLYRQGMILPNHPNNTGMRPLLIGSKEQVNAQMEYIYRGNYGLTSLEEILETGIPDDLANQMMDLKMKFAFGNIRPTAELLDARIIENEPMEIRNGVVVQRKGFNQYEFQYKGKSVVIDLNLKVHEAYEAPYPLEFHQIEREYFAVIHTGEGDGWDVNRPCMASILMYLGKIYLIDAGPNILQTLRALSIDISEIEGIFHTHAHDDHFAGLPTLMQADHRLKYYATPLVRKSVAQKLAALMSIDESKFFQYFEVCDLQFDTWNDLDGLEVKPFFSPHPVETNIFLFRTLGEDGYKTYAHWADTVSLEILKKMTADDKSTQGHLKTLYESIKANYLATADIKKVDIGGGLIHGQAGDLKKDTSKEIILAHTSEKLNEQQKEIGSERSFGTVDVLMSANQIYLRKQAAQLLRAYFPNVSFEQLRPLLNVSMTSFNPGSIIQKQGSRTSYIYFILTGTVEFISTELGIQNHLSNGCFIGDVPLLKNTTSSGTWRAVSYVQALSFTVSLYSAFLEKFGLYEQMNTILDKIDFLQNTFLFGEGISYPVQNKIAQHMILDTYAENEQVLVKESPWICLLKTGELQITNARKEGIETLKIGDFCGEESLFADIHDTFRVQATQPSEVYLIKNYPLLEIPVVHWKLLEIYAKRTKILDSLNK
jgi:hemerythrin